MRTYKLYASTSANNAASITIQRSGRIKSIRWAILVDTIVDNSSVQVELSTQPVSQRGTNDTLGSIDEIAWAANVGANGSAVGAINHQRLMDYAMVAGERLYLNTSLVTAAANITCFIDFAD